MLMFKINNTENRITPLSQQISTSNVSSIGFQIEINRALYFRSEIILLWEEFLMQVARLFLPSIICILFTNLFRWSGKIIEDEKHSFIESVERIH